MCLHLRRETPEMYLHVANIEKTDLRIWLAVTSNFDPIVKYILN